MPHLPIPSLPGLVVLSVAIFMMVYKIIEMATKEDAIIAERQTALTVEDFTRRRKEFDRIKHETFRRRYQLARRSGVEREKAYAWACGDMELYDIEDSKALRALRDLR